MLNKSIQPCVIFTRQTNQNPSATHDPTQRSYGEDSQFSVNANLVTSSRHTDFFCISVVVYHLNCAPYVVIAMNQDIMPTYFLILT